MIVAETFYNKASGGAEKFLGRPITQVELPDRSRSLGTGIRHTRVARGVEFLGDEFLLVSVVKTLGRT